MEDNLLQSGIAFGIRKGLSYKEIIDEVVLKYRDNEKIITLQKKWFQSFCQPTFYAATQTSLAINRFGGMIFVLAITAVFSFPLLIPEHLYTKYMKNILSDKIRKIFRTKTNKYTVRAMEYNNQGLQKSIPTLYKHMECSTQL